MNGRQATLLIAVLLGFSCHAGPPVRTGADVLIERRLDLLRNRRIGLLTNQTGILSSGTSLVDTLVSLGMHVTALFSPEHGIRGNAPAGAAVHDTTDAATGLPVYSLYAGTRSPTPEMLAKVDVLVYDLQDVGVRCYTYVSTMKLAMEAAAEAHVPFIVLDRPDPLGGRSLHGPVMEDSLRSFIGSLPIPVVYGLTCGELAAMINGEGWLARGVRATLTVVPMEGWRRAMRWEETGLRWVRPSPNMTSPRTAEVYPGMVLLEATSLSEGRGTDEPFFLAGAPFVDVTRVVHTLSGQWQPAVQVVPAEFTPSSSKHSGRRCHGIRISMVQPDAVDPVGFGIGVLQAFLSAHPDSVRIDRKFLERLLGSGSAVEDVLKGKDPGALVQSWVAGLAAFREKASKYVIYTE